jgi:hypothetical protein
VVQSQSSGTTLRGIAGTLIGIGSGHPSEVELAAEVEDREDAFQVLAGPQQGSHGVVQGIRGVLYGRDARRTSTSSSRRRGLESFGRT